MKKLKLNQLRVAQLETTQMQTLKGGGVCACRHQGERRSVGYRRGAVKDFIESLKYS